MRTWKAPAEFLYALPARRGWFAATVILTALLCCRTAAAQAQAPPGYRAYALRAAQAEEVAAQVKQLLNEMAPGANVLLDAEQNAILISGDQAANRIAAQLIATLDRPSVDAPLPGEQPQQSVQGYRPADGDLEKLEKRLREKIAGQANARVVAHSRTGQVVVVAPQAIHRQIEMMLSPGDKPPPTGDHRLEFLTPAQLQAALKRIFGDRVAVDQQAGGASISAVGEGGAERVMHIDYRGRIVQFQGAQETEQFWRQVVFALDRERKAPSDVTQFMNLSKAAPSTVERAVQLLQTASRQRATNGATTMMRTGGGGDQFVSRIFQQPPDENAGDQPADPAAPPAEGDDPLDAEAGGLIGPVDIQFIPGTDIVIISGHQRDVAKVEALIEEIERQTKETQPIIEIVHLQHVPGESLALLIEEVYNEILVQRQGQVSITPLVEPNALLLVGRPESMEVIKDLILKLDQPVEPETTFDVIKLRYISSTDAAARITAAFSPAGATTAQPAAPVGAVPGQAAAGGVQVTSAGIGPRVVVVSDYRSNTLIVRASPRDMLTVRSMIQAIDVDDSAAQAVVQIFKLKNALASDLARVLQDAINWQIMGQQQPFQGTGQQGFQQQFQQGGQFQQGTQTTLPSRTLELLMVDPEGGRLLRSGILADVRITADTPGNALIVTAPAKSMDLIAKLIEQLDKLPQAEAYIKVFTLENSDATSLAQMLQQLFGQTITAGQGAFGQALNQALRQTGGGLQASAGGAEGSLVPLRFAVDVRTNSIIVTGSTGDLNVVETLITRLDVADISTRTTKVIRLKNAPALDVATAITSYLNSQFQVTSQFATAGLGDISVSELIDQQVIVVPELVTNSLIVSVSPRYEGQIMEIINKLDFKPSMVFVQVIIAEVDLNDLFEFGVELGLQDSLLFNRSGLSTGTLTPGYNFNNSPLGNSGDDISLSSRELLAGQALSNFALGRSSAAAGYGGLVLSAANESVNILIRALEQQGRMQVLSRPSIMTLDNQEAFVQVGADVPRITDSQLTPQGGTTNSTTDVPTGLILRIRPRINQDRMVVMEIDADKSAVGPINEGIPIAVTADGQTVLSPQIERTTAQSTIQAYSGQTVVFAGLITRNRAVTRRGIPFLSNLPLVGQLFRFDSDSESRSELLIIMTPHVIDDASEQDALNFAESDRMSWCLADVVEMTGMTGLSGGNGLWGPPHAPMTIFPDEDPTATESLPGPPVMQDDGSIMMSPRTSTRRSRPPQSVDAAMYLQPPPGSPHHGRHNPGPMSPAPIAEYGPPPNFAGPYGAAPAAYHEPPRPMYSQHPAQPPQYPSPPQRLPMAR